MPKAAFAISADDVRAAARVIDGHVVRTPTAASKTLSVLTGARVVVKFENLQFTGSFKERGARNRLATLTAAERRRGVVAASAGNHAQGLAHCSAELGVPATIVMPTNTPFVKVEHTAQLGAEIVLDGVDLAEAYGTALRIQAERDLVMIHAYDDPMVIAGQGTVGLELVEQVPDLDMIVVPVGGGGLIAGIATIVADLLPTCQVIGVQSAACPSMVDALAGRDTVASDPIGLADGISVKHAGRLTAPIVAKLVRDVMVVDEEHIERAVALYIEVEKTVAEGAAAAGLAALLAHPDWFRDRHVGLVLTGGNIDSRLLAEVLHRNLVREGRLTRFSVLIDDRPGQLARVARVFAEAGANVIEVQHQRLSLRLPARQAVLDVLLETRDRAHTQAVRQALADAGFSSEVALA